MDKEDGKISAFYVLPLKIPSNDDLILDKKLKFQNFSFISLQKINKNDEFWRYLLKTQKICFPHKELRMHDKAIESNTGMLYLKDNHDYR